MAGDVGMFIDESQRPTTEYNTICREDIIHPTCDFSITADAVGFRSKFQNNPNPGASKLELSVEKM